MKPSESRDGEYRLTLHVQARITGNDLTFALAHALSLKAVWSSFDEPEERARALRVETAKFGRLRVEQAMREHIKYEGLERAWTISEEIGGPYCVRAAAARIRELYPTMKVNADEGAES